MEKYYKQSQFCLNCEINVAECNVMTWNMQWNMPDMASFPTNLTVNEEVKVSNVKREKCLMQRDWSCVPSSFIRNWCPGFHYYGEILVGKLW